MTDRLSSDLASLRIDRAPRKAAAPWAKKALITVLALGSLAAGGVWASGALARNLFKPEVASTEIAQLSAAQGAVELTATGYVTAQVVAKVGPKRPGRVSMVRVHEGQTVRAGDVLFELDPADEQSALGTANARTDVARARTAAAEARVQELKIQYDREKLLADQGVRAPAGVEELGARLAALQTEVSAAQAEIRANQSEAGSAHQNLKNTRVLAPIDGTALTRPSQLGDIVGPQTTLVELAAFSSLLVEVDVPEARMERVKLGGPVEIVLDSAPTQRLRGEVAEFSPRVDRSKATALVRVKVTDTFERLWPNMSARVSFLDKPLDAAALKSAPKLIAPKSALLDRHGSTGLFVIEDDKLRWTAVTVGERLASSVVLIDGPAAGTRIVDSPAPELTDGRSVKLKSP